MLFQIKSFLKYLFRSTNHHGVHSPFVFNLVTKCFYDKNKKEWDPQLREILKNSEIDTTLKHSRLLIRILDYLEIENALIFEKETNGLIPIFKINAKTKIYVDLNDTNYYDLIYMDSTYVQKNEDMLSFILPKTQNNSVLIISKPYKNKATGKIWERITNDPKITVSIDCYHLGFIFFRKEQVKEHFVIRL